VAAFIWEQLDGKNSLENIRDDVLDKFDVGKEDAETDVAEFIDELVEAKLIETRNP
jgi:methyltransferase-like protein